MFQLTRSARRDLEEIWSFIAADSEPAADSLNEALLRRIVPLGKNPFLGDETI